MSYTCDCPSVGVVECYHPCNAGCCNGGVEVDGKVRGGAGKPFKGVVKNNISNSRKIVGQNDYKFNRVNKTKQVLNKDVRFTSKMIKKDVKFVETKIDNYNNDVRGGSVKTITSTTSPLVSSIGGKNIDKRFAQSVLDGFQSFGCKFIQNEFRTLSSQLQGMQNAGESGSNVNAKVRKIKFLYNKLNSVYSPI